MGVLINIKMMSHGLGGIYPRILMGARKEIAGTFKIDSQSISQGGNERY